MREREPRRDPDLRPRLQHGGPDRRARAPMRLRGCAGDRRQARTRRAWHWREAEGIPIWRSDAKSLDKSEFFDALQCGPRRAAQSTDRARRLHAHPVRRTSSMRGAAGSSTSTLRCCPNTRGWTRTPRALAAGDPIDRRPVHLVTERARCRRNSRAGRGRRSCPDDTPDSLAERVLDRRTPALPTGSSAEFAARPFNATGSRRSRRLAACPRSAERRAMVARLVVGGEKGKLFAHHRDNHHGEDGSACLRQGRAARTRCRADRSCSPRHYYWPKYYGASGWLGMKLNRRDVDWDHVGDRLAAKLGACAPPRLTCSKRAADELRNANADEANPPAAAGSILAS